MSLIGLTGSIGCGKSTVANFFKRFGANIIDSDRIVNSLYKQKNVINELKKLDKSIVSGGILNKQNLFKWIASSSVNKQSLENLIHPLVAKERDREILKIKLLKPCSLIILDIPLLFEAGLGKLCKYNITVYCTDTLQEERVMARPNMTIEKFRYIKSLQISQEKKKELADFIINTNNAKLDTIKQVKTLYRYIKND